MVLDRAPPAPLTPEVPFPLSGPVPPAPDRYGRRFKTVGAGRYEVTFDPAVRDERDPESVRGVFLTGLDDGELGLVPIESPSYRRLYESARYPEPTSHVLFRSEAGNDGHQIDYEVGFSDEIYKLD